MYQIQLNVFYYTIYDNAKSCVKTGENMSMFCSSMSGVRQGENLSPILFSLFLNDLVHFMSNSYNGLSTLSEDVASILNTEDIEVFFKLYLLLYGDDTFFLQSRMKNYKLPLIQCNCIVTLGSYK